MAETVKIYIDRPTESRALGRIADALQRYAPTDTEFVADERAADLIVLQIIGRQDTVRARMHEILLRKQRYAVVQLVLRSTKRPSTVGWLDVWRHAAVVMSYYDLHAAILDDGFVLDAKELQPTFYLAPLGVDTTLFQPYIESPPLPRSQLVATTGASWLTESVREAQLAARQIGQDAWHLGRVESRGIRCYPNVSDEVLVKLYSQTRYVSGLRRLEGFELPAAEGLCCGARPILFEQPHYRRWFGPWAEYIPESPSRQGVIDALVALFSGPYRSVTPEEIDAARQVFNWETIGGGFWRRCLAGIEVAA